MEQNEDLWRARYDYEIWYSYFTYRSVSFKADFVVGKFYVIYDFSK